MSVLPVGIGPVTGYNIQRSLRFRSSASAYLSRTFSTTGTNLKIRTFSAWVKRGILGSQKTIFQCYDGSSSFSSGIWFPSSDTLQVGGGDGNYLITTQVFRDPSAWYHIVIAFDTTQATSTNRLKIYVNGTQITSFGTANYPTQNLNTQFCYNNANNKLGSDWNNGNYFDGYLTEINFIDGQALDPSSFGSTNATTGVWQPAAYSGSYGTNGFYLPFTDNSALTSGSNAGLGKDFSGNGNYWNTNNISVTAGVNNDSFTDVPTQYVDSPVRGNYATGNPLNVNLTTNTSATLTNGNLYINNASANYSGFSSTIGIPTSGKWAWKFKITGSVSGSNDGTLGFACNSAGNPVTGASNAAAANWYTTVQIQYISSRAVVHNYANAGVVTDYSGVASSGTTGDEYEFLIDRGAGTTIVKLNGSTIATVTGLPSTQVLFPYGSFYQTGGYFIFNYTPSDTSYNALCTFNLPTPTIQNGAAYMAATLWTGDGTNPRTITNTVSGVSFQPDLVWTKARNQAYDNSLYDSVRGATNYLISNSTAAQASAANSLQAFNSNGFQVGGNDYTNSGSATYVGWQWKGGGTPAVTNNNGSITSTVSANTTAGFSIVTWASQSSGTATIGHGLGVAPSMIIQKNRSSNGTDWWVYHTSLGATKYLNLNTTGSSGTASSIWNDTAPTTTVFSNGTAFTPSANYVAYCFSAVSGYSAFGSYTGNGSTDGPFVFLGFRPRWILFKADTAGQNWIIFDAARSTYNVTQAQLYPNLSNAEDSGRSIDILSNGFKIRDTSTGINSGTILYACFAESPFKYALGR